jgi:diketogulonate reductase-like aldo/keto reductase
MARHIGVSNFPAAMLERAFEVAPIVTDQVEHHPYLAVDPIRDALARRGGFATAYCPIAKGAVLDDPVLQGIAEQHDVSPVQVTIRWHLQRGVAAIPRSRSRERIVANGDVFGFELTDDEVARIDGLARDERLVDPDFAPVWDAA